MRVKTEKTIYSKGDIATFSKEIYQILEHKGKMSKLKNLNNGEVLKRKYHVEQLEQTFNEVAKQQVVKKKILEDRSKVRQKLEEDFPDLPRFKEKPKLKLEESIAKTKRKRIIKKPVKLDL